MSSFSSFNFTSAYVFYGCVSTDQQSKPGFHYRPIALRLIRVNLTSEKHSDYEKIRFFLQFKGPADMSEGVKKIH